MGVPKGKREPPTDRPSDELDEIIRSTIEGFPSATRLYPESYAWEVADAVRRALAKESEAGR